VRRAAEKPDRIADFTRRRDRIDLSELRAPSTLGNSGGFVLVVRGDLLDLGFDGTAVFAATQEAQLRVAQNRFEVDWDGDGVADKAVILTGAGVLSAGDFPL